ncbi:MAG: hypothetical protein ACP5F2_00405 [Athalassotoga sp.]|uniref:hypothetical protein n=1 Tax=Athalassotoga sp. TaxID=2022597 RepID=UPI003D0076E8
MRFVEDVRVRHVAIENTQVETKVEGIGVIRSLAIGIGIFAVLSVPLLLNIQTLKYNSQITNMTYEINVMKSQILNQQSEINVYLQEKFPSAVTFKEGDQIFFVRSVNPAIKGDAKQAARLAGQ